MPSAKSAHLDALASVVACRDDNLGLAQAIGERHKADASHLLQGAFSIAVAFSKALDYASAHCPHLKDADELIDMLRNGINAEITD